MASSVAQPEAVIAFDHVHLVHVDPHAAAEWYVKALGAKLLKATTVLGAPQIYLAIGDSMLIVRGARPAEALEHDSAKSWGIDHFGFRVSGDFEGFCENLRARGVLFTLEPTEINAATRAAYIEGPDAVRIELLLRREWPNLVNFGVDPATGISNPGS